MLFIQDMTIYKKVCDRCGAYATYPKDWHESHLIGYVVESTSINTLDRICTSIGWTQDLCLDCFILEFPEILIYWSSHAPTSFQSNKVDYEDIGGMVFGDAGSIVKIAGCNRAEKTKIISQAVLNQIILKNKANRND